MKKINNLGILVIGIGLFFISLVFDDSASFLIDTVKNPFFDFIFGWFTSFINVFVILVVVTTLFLWEEKKRGWIFPLWLSFFVSIVFAFILKLMVSRPRPTMELLYPVFNLIDHSFPSMHAMVSFAAIPILDREFTKLKWFWVAFATLVAFSRVYFGFHFLSDVAFGAFMGYFIGVLIIYIEEKYKPFNFIR
jgi:undecaprenyl-diphosphatase